MNRKQLTTKYTSPQFMPILVSEVTRMSMGNYCVAGWDMQNQRMVRPLQLARTNWKLGTDRSLFRVGHLINCIPTDLHNTVYPHANEDLILSTSPTLLETFDEPATYNLLLPTSFRSIREIFGSPLIDGKYIPDNTNCRSLGGVRASSDRMNFLKDRFGKFRLEFRDVDNVVYWLPITCDTLLETFSSSGENEELYFGVPEANEWLRANLPGTEIITHLTQYTCTH